MPEVAHFMLRVPEEHRRISNVMSPWRLESRSLPLGSEPRKIPKPAAFQGTYSRFTAQNRLDK